MAGEGEEEVIRFSMKLSKPFGMQLLQEDAAVVSVAKIGDGGSLAALMEMAIPAVNPKYWQGKRAPSVMPLLWIQERDLLLEVDGVSCEGSMEKAVDLLGKAGDAPILTFSRPKLGNTMVVFPGGQHIVAPRRTKLDKVAYFAEYKCGCSCSKGTCGRCYHKDISTGELYVLPIHVSNIIPSVYEKRKEKPELAERVSWKPLVLEWAPEEVDKYKKAIPKGAAR